ncbi:hypothetical protein [Seohaeicola saemankumensis]|uniref:hypothetical protein n=1 Tax=Seohaeicola saemankumensis TaxID=481181 RepID=UPI0036D39929
MAPRNGLASLSLVVMALTVGIHEVTGATWTWIPGGMAFILGFILPQWFLLVSVARILALVAVGLGVALPLLGWISIDALHRALDQALFFAFFVAMLALLQDTAAQSPLIRRSGTVLLSQPPGRRYSVLTFGGMLMGVLLNLGTLSLLGTMIAQGVAQGRGESGDRVADIRLRRMSLAMLRGFCTVPLWSPTSISMPIVLAALPGLAWLELLPYGAGAAAVLLGIGWLLDRLSYHRPAAPPAAQPWVRPLLPLVGLIATIPAVGMAVGGWLDVRMITAILVSIPAIVLVWQTVQRHGSGQARPILAAARALATETLPKLPNFRSEMVIFAASGAIAILILPLIDVEALGSKIVALGLGEGPVMVAGFVTIFALSFLGINSIVTVSVLMGVLPNLPGLEFVPIHLALMALTGWTLSVGISPLSAAVRITSRAIEQEPAILGIRWNGIYASTSAGLVSVVLLILGGWGG